MEIERLVGHMKQEARDYRSGRTLGRAFADAEDVLDEAVGALEQLQAENERLKAERDLAIEQLRGYCNACKNYMQNYNDGPCATCKHEYSQYQNADARDNWEWNGGKANAL